MHPTILGSVQRRATLERVHASFRPFSTNALLHPSYIRVLYIYIYVYVRAFTEPFAFALQPTASRAPFSPSMLRSLTPFGPSWPDWIYSAAAFISRRGNPSQSVLVPRTQPRRKSRFVTEERSSRFFSISQAPIPRPSAFVLFLPAVDSIRTSKYRNAFS